MRHRHTVSAVSLALLATGLVATGEQVLYLPQTSWFAAEDVELDVSAWPVLQAGQEPSVVRLRYEVHVEPVETDTAELTPEIRLALWLTEAAEPMAVAVDDCAGGDLTEYSELVIADTSEDSPEPGSDEASPTHVLPIPALERLSCPSEEACGPQFCITVEALEMPTEAEPRARLEVGWSYLTGGPEEPRIRRADATPMVVDVFVSSD